MDATPLTFSQLLNNPAGPNSRYGGSRQLILGALQGDYRRLVEDPGRRARFRVRASADGEHAFLVRVSVPSMTVKVDFDVLLRLDFSKGPDLAEAGVQLFCNSPGWVFTYAYVAGKQGLLVPAAAWACGNQALSVRPRETNPPEEMGFDKVVEFAGFWLVRELRWHTRADAERAAASGAGAADPADPSLEFGAKLRAYQAARDASIELRRRERLAAKAAPPRAAARPAPPTKPGRQAAARPLGTPAKSSRSARSAPSARKAKSR